MTAESPVVAMIHGFGLMYPAEARNDEERSTVSRQGSISSR